MKKRLLSTLLAIAVLLSFVGLVGCNTGEPKTPAAEGTPAQSTPTAPSATEVKWPNRTVTICTGGTGGANDYGARLWAKKMSAAWGVDVIVQNYDVTVDAVRQMANKGDDHILFFDNITQLIKSATGMFELTLNDYKPVCFTAAHPGTVLAVRTDSGITTLKEFYDYCESRPGEVNVSDQLGSSTGVCVKGLIDNGFKINRVETGDTGERITSLLGGHLDAILGPYGTIGPYEESGDLTVLCLFREERNENFDHVPSAKESSIDVSMEVPFMFLANNSLSDEACQKISDFCESVCATEEYAAQILEAQKWSVFFRDFEETKPYLQKQYDWFVSLDLLA